MMKHSASTADKPVTVTGCVKPWPPAATDRTSNTEAEAGHARWWLASDTAMATTNRHGRRAPVAGQPPPERERDDTTLDDTIESSFPASDPPSTIPNPHAPRRGERPRPTGRGEHEPRPHEDACGG